MNQWINHSHPQTLRAAVILGYLNAVFGLLGSGIYVIGGFGALLVNSILLGVGAFATANNKRWGYVMLVVASLVDVVQHVLLIATASWNPIALVYLFNLSIFSIALFAAAIHSQSRDYQKIWFE